MQIHHGDKSRHLNGSKATSETIAPPEVSRIAEIERKAVIYGVVLPSWELVHEAIWKIAGIDPHTQFEEGEMQLEMEELRQFVSELLEKLKEPGAYTYSFDYNNPANPDKLLPDPFLKRTITIKECKTGWVFETRRVSRTAAEGIKDIGSLADGYPIGQQATLTCTLYADAEGRGVANPVAATELLNGRGGIEAGFDDQQGLLTVRLKDEELTYTFRVAVDRGWYSVDDISAKIDGKWCSLGPEHPQLGYDTRPPYLRVTCLSDTGGYWVETHKGIEHLPQVMDLVQEAFLLTHNGAPSLSNQDLETFRGDISRFPVAAMEAQAFRHILTQLQTTFELQDANGKVNAAIARLDDVLKGGVRDGKDILARLQDETDNVERRMDHSIFSELNEAFDSKGLTYQSEDRSSSTRRTAKNGSEKFLEDLAATASGNRHLSDAQYLPSLEARKGEIDRLFSRVASRFQFDNEDQRRAFISLQGIINRDPDHPLTSAMEVWETREDVLKAIKNCCDNGGVYELLAKSMNSIPALAQREAARVAKQRKALVNAGILDEEGRPTPATKSVAKYILVSEGRVQLDGAKVKV